MFCSNIHFYFFVLKMYQLGTSGNLWNSNPHRIASFIFMILRFLVQWIKKQSGFLSKYAIFLMFKKKLQNQAIFKLTDLNVFYLCFKKALLPQNAQIIQSTSCIWTPLQKNTKTMRVHGRHPNKSKWNSDNEIFRYENACWAKRKNGIFIKITLHQNDIKKRSIQNNFKILSLFLNCYDPVGLQTRSGLM